MRKHLTFYLMLIVTTSYAVVSRSATPDDAPFWTGQRDAASFAKLQEDRLANAKQSLDRMLAVTGKRTIENTLKPYDKMMTYLDAVANQASLITKVHPDEAVRKAAEKISRKAEAFNTEVSLNRAVYDAIAALDLAGADSETRYYVERILRDFRLAGVDKDEATRKRIKELRDELVVIGQDFGRNITDDKGAVIANSIAELEGLPVDYVARHKPGPDGKITFTTDYSDYLPVVSYAKNEDLRKRMYIAYNNRAYPQNMAVLNRMIARRHELANLAGFPNWADYITADKMVGSGKNAAMFIDRIDGASKTIAAKEYKTLLTRKQKDVPAATVVNAWERDYYAELVRKSEYNFDSQSVRPYFQYDKVKQGLLDVTSKLFRVTFQPAKNVAVWHPAVEAYEMLEGGKVVGRFYLDMHPRAGKYNHAAEFSTRTGIAGQQIPEAALVCNFPGGDQNDPGLMEHDDVQTFFHEFGHLIHELFAGRHNWVGVGGTRVEQDFLEAPSQMLEEWTWDPATLRLFAKHYQTNEPIPVKLIKQMRRASEFGKAVEVRNQMFYAKLSLSIYDRPPADVNTDTMLKTLWEKYRPYPFVDGTHRQTSFGHLDDYSAVYYTYMWSLVIAKDMFSRFNKSNLESPVVAKRYRDSVLAPGGSQPANKLVESFLSRPFNFNAWQAWLEGN